MKYLRSVRGLVIIITVFMTIGVNGCGLLPKEETALAPPLVKPKQEDYSLYKVKKSDISLVVKGMGVMVPTIQVPLYMKESGHRLKSINVQSGQTVKKGTVVAEMDEGDLPNQIKIEQFAVKIAEDDLKDVQEKRAKSSLSNTPTATELDKSQLSVYKEQETLRQMQQQLADTKITSTIDGQVVFVGEQQQGDSIGAFDPIVKVADTSKLQISFDTTDFSKVKIGMTVDITYSGSKYTGVVAMLPSVASKDADKKNSILITSSNVISNCKLGSSVDLAIAISTKQDTLVVPRAAVQSLVGTNIVEIMDGSKKIDLNVEVGIQTPTDVEILSGLKEGQMVILK